MAAKKSGKSKGQDMEEKLLLKMEPMAVKNPGLLEESMAFNEDYKEFIRNKTEREIVDYCVPIIKKAGYKEFVYGTKYKPGSKVYFVNRGKNLIMLTVGKRPFSEGMRIAVAHSDSPRLDLKPNPLFEADEMAYLKTHYYGGIKKYQWPTVPMSLHGVVCLKDGKTVNIRIGEDPNDPIFYITDLLVHLAYDQVTKPANKVIEGEQLNLLVGSWPVDDEKVKAKVKLNVMRILNEKYGIDERDFQSAEICACPAHMPRDVGFDRSMVAAYGQDDKVCCYAQFRAELETKNPEFTSMMVFADKEETGSDGPTGMSSSFWRDFIEDLIEPYGDKIRHVRRSSICLSCDVSAAVDPSFHDVFEMRNCSFLGRGPVISKYGGARGKYSTNDATAESVAYIRDIIEGAGLPYQTGELGRIDAGGGGTIANYVSQYNIDTFDMGVPVLSMHSTLEITSKADNYVLYKIIKEIFASKKTLKY